MKAIIIKHPGGPEVLQLEDRETPAPKDGEVLVKIAAAGVNRPDIFQRKGNYPAPAWTSADIPGLEVSGTVAGIGKHCTRWKMGDRVCALLTGGGYAEYTCVPEGQCLPLPAGLSFISAASLPETYFTVWSNVFMRAHLSRGETLLVHGGTSGIGVAAIQLAVAAGATAWATAGSDEKCRFCSELGATMAINYNTEEFKAAIRNRPDKRGPDVILDMVGGNYTQPNLDVLNDDGRLVLINHMQGEEAQIRLGAVMRKRLTITGSTLRSRSSEFKASIARELEETVWPWIVLGAVKPIVDKTFELHNAADAHRWMEGGQHIGKIILTVGD